MLVAVIIVLTAVFWFGSVILYFKQEIYVWFDSRWGPQSRPVKPKRNRRGIYD